MIDLFTTREAADEINKAEIMPSSAKPLNQRGVARLCKLGHMVGAYLVQGDWCIPQTAINSFIDAIKNNSIGRAPYSRKKKDA